VLPERARAAACGLLPERRERGHDAQVVPGRVTVYARTTTGAPRGTVRRR
jgi:hypothetical protein